MREKISLTLLLIGVPVSPTRHSVRRLAVALAKLVSLFLTRWT